MVSDLPEPCVCQITPPRRPPVGLKLFDAREDVLDRKELLIPGDLLDAEVEQREPAYQIEQAIRAAQRIEDAILLGDLAPAFHHVLEWRLFVLKSVAKCAPRFIWS